MRCLTLIDLVSHLSLGVVHQNSPLSTLDEDHECGDQDNQGNDKEHCQCTHGAGADQLEQAREGAGQTGDNAREDDDRDAIAKATLGDLLAEPHQEHGACDQ